MKINIGRVMELDSDEIRKMQKVFQANSAHGRHYCYVDSEGRIYIKNAYCEVDQYLIFEINSDSGVFFVIEFDTTDVGIIHGNTPEVNIHVAVLNGKIATTKLEATEFLVSKVEQFLKNEGVDTCGVRDSLWKSLLNSRKFIKAVGALNQREVDEIIAFDGFNNTGNQHEIINANRVNSPDFSWKDDARAMEVIRDEASSGPFGHIIIFFKE